MRCRGRTNFLTVFMRPAFVTVAVCAFVAACGKEEARDLPALGADIDQTSTSGISSGAYMAGQYQMAHGREVVGAAIIAGGPYGCAESVFAPLMPAPGAAMMNVSRAVNGCMLNALALWGVPDSGVLADKARRLAEEGAIDPIDSDLSDRVYLFAGKNDRTVVPEIVAHAAEFYGRLGLPSENIKFETGIDAGHAFVTEGSGLACNRTGEPYVVDCNYDQAKELLAHILGPLKPASAAPEGTYSDFDQRPYVENLGDHGMADTGVVYIPRDCEDGPGCRVHVAYHGCAQNRDMVGDAFIKGTGFARWADANRLIILFPQTTTELMNSQGCWDWWGYTGRDFLTRRAPQIEAVHRMLQKLATPRQAPS